MNKLKVLFVGIGSIAKRHISNLQDICRERGRECEIDAFRSGVRRESLHQSVAGITKMFFDEAEVPSDYDVVFITNPTKYHLESLTKFHEKGRHFFIEKPVCVEEQLEKIKCLSWKEESIYYVACPLRYTSVIQYLKENINFQDVLSVRCISSSYLPEWREGTDYRQSYSAHRSLGGGVSSDLIHEWDYLCYLLGRPLKVYSLIGKVSDLEINTDDIAIYIAQYHKTFVELHLDYFGRNPIRQIQIFMEDDTLLCDLIESSILFMKSGKRLEFGQERNDYQRKELHCFLDMIEKRTENDNNIDYACDILRLTKGILG